MGIINKITDNPEPYLYNFWTSEVIKHKRDAQISFVKLGEALYNIYQKNLYQEGKFKNFKEYLNSAYIDIKYSTAMQLIRIYQKYIIELKVSPERIMNIDYSKLDIIAPVVKQNNIDELLAAAEDIPRKTLRKNIKSLKYKKNVNITNQNKRETKVKFVKNSYNNTSIFIMFANGKKYDITVNFVSAVKLYLSIIDTKYISIGKITIFYNDMPEKQKIDGLKE